LVKGSVKWFDKTKGFGFINSEGENDIFVHFSALIGDDDENDNKTLNENDEVEFDVVQGEKGPQANNVVVTLKAPPSEKRSYSGGRGGGGRSGGGRSGDGRGGGGRSDGGRSDGGRGGGGRGGKGYSGGKGSRKARGDRKGRSRGTSKRSSY
jgi:CspA family cold shock protein